MPLTLKDALRLAAKDQAFAADLVAHPENYKAQFNITDAQMKHLTDFERAVKTHLGGLGGVVHGGAAGGYE